MGTMSNSPTSEQEVTKAMKPLRNADIEAHPLLFREQHALIKAMRSADRSTTFYDFARVALCASAADYVNADDDDMRERAKTMRALQRAALLFVYEALKACDHAIITEWPEFDIMLQQLEDLDKLGFPQ